MMHNHIIQHLYRYLNHNRSIEKQQMKTQSFNNTILELNTDNPQPQKKALEQILSKEMTPSAFISSKYHNRSIIFDKLLCMAVILHFVVLGLYVDFRGEKWSEWWLVVSSICGILTAIIIVSRFLLRNQYLLQVRSQTESFWLLGMNLMVTLIMPYPFLRNVRIQFNTPDNSTQISQFSLNYLLTTLSCMRFLPLAASIMTRSKYLRPRCYRISKMNGATSDMLFALQSYFKDRPFSFIGIVSIASVALFSFSLRVAQCRFLSADPYTAYANVVWMIAMTMTTVGFGDMSPVTPLGRIVAAVCAIWGVLILAVMVGVLTHILSLDAKETQSILILKKLQSKEKIKEEARKYLRVSLARLWTNYKYKLDKHETLEQRKLKQTFSAVRKKPEHQSKEDTMLNLVTEMDREFERVSTQMEYLIKNNTKIIHHLTEQVVFKSKEEVDIPSGTSFATRSLGKIQ